MKRSKRESVLLNGERSLSHRVSPVLATKSPTLGKTSLPPHPGLLPLSLAASPLFSRTKTHDSLLTEKQSHLMKRVTPCETRALLSFPSPLPWRREQGTSGKGGLESGWNVHLSLAVCLGKWFTLSCLSRNSGKNAAMIMPGRVMRLIWDHALKCSQKTQDTEVTGVSSVRGRSFWHCAWTCHVSYLDLALLLRLWRDFRVCRPSAHVPRLNTASAWQSCPHRFPWHSIISGVDKTTHRMPPKM